MWALSQLLTWHMCHVAQSEQANMAGEFRSGVEAMLECSYLLLILC